MKHLVTGGSGFLGNLIARRLRAQGESVVVLDTWEDPTRPGDIPFIQGDVRERDAVARALKGVDIVHHTAARVPLTKAGVEFWSVNVEGSRIVAEEAARAGVKTFIHMSSSAIFGAPKHCPITNSTMPRPIEIYGRSKLAAELAVRQVCNRNGMQLIIIRPRTILGQGRLGIFQILFQWIAENRRIYIIGNGNQLFQFVHADDLIDAYMLVMQSGRSGAYNIGTDRFGTLRETLQDLIGYAKSKSRLVGLPAGPTIAILRLLDWFRLSPLAPWHYLTYHKPFYFDVGELLQLGWRPKYSNVEMLRESYDWFLKNRSKLAAHAAGSPHRSVVAERLLALLKRFS